MAICQLLWLYISVIRRKGRMKLEIGNIDIKDVRFGNNTEINDGILSINREELVELLLSDRRLMNISIELAHPGEKTRIYHVSDVIEPQARTGDRKGQFSFPGATGIRGTAGDGRLNRLRGICVTLSDQGGPGVSAFTGISRAADEPPLSSVIDMAGPGAEISPFGKLHNVVLLAYPADGVDEEAYAIALKIAGLRTADYLGSASVELEPHNVEVFELPQVTEIAKGAENLPKVGFIYQMNWGQWYALTGEPIYYGSDAKRFLPTIIHPNEILDGAIVKSYLGFYESTTYAIQNHPMIIELYRRHRIDLCFMGVILDMSICFEPERERAMNIAAKLAKEILGVDGLILNKFGGGAPMVDTSQRALACERLGMKTVIIQGDIRYPDGGNGLIFNYPECNAIVNTGALVVPIMQDTEQLEQVIGLPAEVKSPVANGPTGKPIQILGAIEQLGSSKLRAFYSPAYRQQMVEKSGAERSVDMLLAKINGNSFETEVPLPQYEPPIPAKPIKDIAKANIGLISSGCVIPKGNPDGLTPGFSTSFSGYSIKDIDRLCSDGYKVYHIGFKLDYVNKDLNRIVPLDVMRAMEKEGIIGKLNDTYYTYAGAGTSPDSSSRIAKGIIKRLKADGVDAVILVST
jgi:sarcosine reductase